MEIIRDGIEEEIKGVKGGGQDKEDVKSRGIRDFGRKEGIGGETGEKGGEEAITEERERMREGKDRNDRGTCNPHFSDKDYALLLTESSWPRLSHSLAGKSLLGIFSQSRLN